MQLPCISRICVELFAAMPVQVWERNSRRWRWRAGNWHRENYLPIKMATEDLLHLMKSKKKESLKSESKWIYRGILTWLTLESIKAFVSVLSSLLVKGMHLAHSWCHFLPFDLCSTCTFSVLLLFWRAKVTHNNLPFLYHLGHLYSCFCLWIGIFSWAQAVFGDRSEGFIIWNGQLPVQLTWMGSRKMDDLA